MLRRFVQFLLVGCFLAIPAVAQRGGGFHGGMGGFRGGMGGFHGGMGGFHGGGYAGSGFHTGFAHGGYVHGGYVHGGYVHGSRGYWGYRGYYPGNRFVFGFGYPYLPYYGTGWWYPYYGYTYYPYSVSYPYRYEYPNYGDAYTYSGADQSSCPQANGKALYLIKLTYTNNIWVAQDYWYAGDTLNFITVQGEQNKTPIDSIDRVTTFQLNRECGVNFPMPR